MTVITPVDVDALLFNLVKAGVIKKCKEMHVVPIYTSLQKYPTPFRKRLEINFQKDINSEIMFYC